MGDSEAQRAVGAHYGRRDLLAKILDQARADGKDLEALTPADLAPFDQFHSYGSAATAALLKLANLPRGSQVLDIGGGFGGPARTLAVELDARVTVLDLTEEYCRVGEALTARTRLSERVVFLHGSALDMPFPDQAFDAAWMQNVGVNIADKARLFAQVRRVLRPRGRLVMQDVVAGPVQPLRYFPVPWAHDASMNFMVSADEMRALVAAAGFREVTWQDATETLRQAAPTGTASSTPSVPIAIVVFGETRGAEIMRNSARNYEEGRATNILAVFERD